MDKRRKHLERCNWQGFLQGDCGVRGGRGSAVIKRLEGNVSITLRRAPSIYGGTLERVQKRDQLLLLFGAEVHLEALIVEIH